MTTQTKPDLYQKVTDQIIACLEKGTVPWHRSWGAFGLAKNYVSGKAYRGINALMMNLAPVAIPYFLSMRQANKLGGKVKKGSKAHQVIYVDKIYMNKAGKRISKAHALKLPKENVEEIYFLKTFPVFATEQIEGIDFEFPEVEQKDHKPIQACEDLIGSIADPPKLVSINASRCYYEPLLDRINMPPISHFETPEEYYNSYFHELVHSTGHRTRLNRSGIADLSIDRSSYGYSHEELIAELGASYLCGITGITSPPLLENNAAYLNGWLSVLKKDKKFIFQVAKEAQRAVDWVTDDKR